MKQLRRSISPDVPDYVIHLTGRMSNFGATVGDGIKNMTPVQRLASILFGRQIIGSTPYGGTDRVVCFTETTPSALARLTEVGNARYIRCGIGFHKQVVFENRGGPAFYVRGDEWPDVEQMPPRLRARATRYWPGMTDQEIQAERNRTPSADEVLFGTYLPPYLTNPSEWTHEREWRIPVENGVGAWMFNPWDVAFLITPTREDLNEVFRILERWGNDGSLWRNRTAYCESLPMEWSENPP